MIEASTAVAGIGALLSSLLAALLLVPVAMRLAKRIQLYDKPEGWKAHRFPTPYLGGPIVLAAMGVGVALFGEGSAPLAVVVAALALAALGTVDDAVRLHAWPRVVLEAAAAAAASLAGAGWELTGVDAVDLCLTVIWVLAVINAFNLLDLMDGVATTSLCATALAVATLAAIEGNIGLFAGSLALSGAGLGFLRYNLAAPARIFLGDGGTMPLGFLAAVAICAALRDQPAGEAVPAAVLLFAVPLLDAAYRSALRLRIRVPLMTARLDSLTNRLRDRLGSERAVCAVIAGAQGLAGASALVVVEWGALSAALVCGLLSVLALSAIRQLPPLPEPQPP